MPTKCKRCHGSGWCHKYPCACDAGWKVAIRVGFDIEDRTKQKAAVEKAKAARDKEKADAKAARDKEKADAKAARDKEKADARTPRQLATKRRRTPRQLATKRRRTRRASL